MRGRLGGFDGRALSAGDKLPLALPQAPERGELRLEGRVPYGAGDTARVVLGPQEQHFTEAGIAAFLQSSFTISNQADRMGLRLDGPTLEHAAGHDIVSDGIATGSIQVPGTGLPIILLADHQTTGGYPKIATVASVDLPKLGRMRPARPCVSRRSRSKRPRRSGAPRRTKSCGLSTASRRFVRTRGWTAKPCSPPT